MNYVKGNLGFFIAFLLLGAILGSALGTLLVRFLPALAFLKVNLTGAIGLNLEIISFSLKINLASIIGILIGIFVYRKV